jgi:uncharacterized protein YbjT (DUF2867 family)
MEQYTALVAGANGLIGNELVQLLLAHPSYASVHILVRNKISLIHPKLHQLIVNYDELSLEKLQPNHVFCCLGSTIAKAGSQEAFSKVDKEYPLQLAKVAIDHGASCFAIVTAGGANATSSIFYNRVKGEVEQGLQQLNFEHLGIFRPSMLLGNRSEKRSIEKMGQRVMVLLDFLIPKRYKAIQASRVAMSMLAFALNAPAGVTIYESDIMNVETK